MSDEKVRKPIRIAAFGFRSVPPRDGCAGADKFAEELFTRLVEKGNTVTAYNRLYPQQERGADSYRGVNLIYIPITDRKGFDTLLHSLKSTWHIIRYNTGDIIHVQNGGNSIWALFLRLAGKKVFISQDGIDWKRDKWPWYGKLYLVISSYLTAYLPNKVIFDNEFVRRTFEERFNKKFDFIPFGSEVTTNHANSDVLERLGLTKGEYYLFVGRFIPDKGLQYLIPAFENTDIRKKLVLVGGSPNPSPFEQELMNTKDPRIVFPGFIYGADANALMKNAYAYVQPSDVEGLSPVILENMGLCTPVICSNIQENLYVVGDTALTFAKGDTTDLTRALNEADSNSEQLQKNAIKAKARADKMFSWDAVTQQHVDLFNFC
jgi:glycosyltransferase involved in cell wall biosynthesis